MICNSCNYEFCWICSLGFKSVVHVLSTPFCTIMNGIVYHEGNFDKMKIKCLWIRFLACYLLFILGPPLMIALAPIFTLIFGPCFFHKELFREFSFLKRFDNYRFFVSFIASYILLILFIGLSPLWVIIYYVVFFMFSLLIFFE